MFVVILFVLFNYSLYIKGGLQLMNRLIHLFSFFKTQRYPVYKDIKQTKGEKLRHWKSCKQRTFAL